MPFLRPSFFCRRETPICQAWRSAKTRTRATATHQLVRGESQSLGVMLRVVFGRELVAFAGLLFRTRRRLDGVGRRRLWRGRRARRRGSDRVRVFLGRQARSRRDIGRRGRPASTPPQAPPAAMRLDRLSRVFLASHMFVVLGVGDQRFAVHRQGREHRRGIVPSQVSAREFDDQIRVLGNALLLDEVVEGDLMVAEEPVGGGLRDAKRAEPQYSRLWHRIENARSPCRGVPGPHYHTG